MRYPALNFQSVVRMRPYYLIRICILIQYVSTFVCAVLHYGQHSSLVIILHELRPLGAKPHVGGNLSQFIVFLAPDDISQAADRLVAKLRELAADDNVDGILVQLPLPKGYDERYLLSLIPDSKDVDGFSPTNMGLLAMNKPRTISCTPYGVMKLIESTGTSLKGKRAVVIGRSNTVGKPMAMLLLNADCTVTVCHSKTADLAKVASEADILVAAIGKPRFVTADMVKEGAIVIDVGINRVDGKLVGDVDFDAVKDKASFITPVPGGVGPMTITMLLANTLQAAEKAEESR